MGRISLAFMLLIGISGCANEDLAENSSNKIEQESEIQPLDNNNTAQKTLELMRAREARPGRTHYEQVCAHCHEGAIEKAPHRDILSYQTPEAILRTITTGIMVEEASSLSSQQKVEVSEYLAGSDIGSTQLAEIPKCTKEVGLDLSKPPQMNNWGLQPTNTRHIPKEIAKISAKDIVGLKQKWALKFPGASRARSQPTMAGGLIFVGSHNAKVYALDQETGCEVWAYDTSGEVRTGIVIDEWKTSMAQPKIYFGDVLGMVYAIDAATGTEIWKHRADEHPNATITGTPTIHNGKILASVSSLEVSLAVNPKYECCTFRGSVVAYDASSGEQLWKTYTIDEPAKIQGQNPVGTNIMGPSGATVWNSPSIDAKRNQLYIGTGENMSSPATLTSDAIFAIDIDTGKVNWTFQATANDVWNTACDTDSPENCPPEGGPDFDFGCATLLTKLSDGTELVVAGQKSGFVHALNPDNGKLVWQTQVGRGGIQGGVHFGMATNGERLFVGISDMRDGRAYPTPRRAGLHAVDLNNGEIIWYSEAPENVCGNRSYCHPGISQAVTAIGNTVFAGGMDGVMRIHDAKTGSILREIDSTKEFMTVNGEITRGGSFGGAAGPIALDGMVILSSGYNIYNHMAGNLLLALEPSK